MPVLVRFGSTIVRMQLQDHAPPHVHVVGTSFSVLVRISDAEIIAGSIRRAQIADALDWIGRNKEELMQLWTDLGAATDMATKELPRLCSVHALEPFRLEVGWKGGGNAIVDVSRYVHKFRLYTPLREDPELFSRARLDEYGVVVEWTDWVDMSALSIAVMAQEQGQFAPEFTNPFKTPELTTP